MSKKVTVYNLETGESVIVPGIDAREYVKNGGWSKSPPAQAEDKAPVDVPGADESDAGDADQTEDITDDTAPAEDKAAKKSGKAKK